MRILGGVLAGSLLIALSVLPQEKKPEEKKPGENSPAEFKIPTEEAERQNPVKPTPASLADGKRMYGFDCAMCHGAEGDGKGDLVEPMGLKMRDWRDPTTLEKVTDGEMFYIISKGKGKMPGDEDRLKPERRWNVVNYIRSLAKKPAAGPAKAEKPS